MKKDHRGRGDTQQYYLEPSTQTHYSTSPGTALIAARPRSTMFPAGPRRRGSCGGSGSNRRLQVVLLFAAAGLQGAPSRLPLAAAAAPAPAATAAKLAGTLCTYPCNNYTLAATHLHVHTSTCRLLLLQQLHLQQLQQNLQQQYAYALTPATTLHTCTCTSYYTLALHVGTRT